MERRLERDWWSLGLCVLMRSIPGWSSDDVEEEYSEDEDDDEDDWGS